MVPYIKFQLSNAVREECSYHRRSVANQKFVLTYRIMITNSNIFFWSKNVGQCPPGSSKFFSFLFLLQEI